MLAICTGFSTRDGLLITRAYARGSLPSLSAPAKHHPYAWRARVRPAARPPLVVASAAAGDAMRPRAIDELPPAAAIWRTALPLFAACLCEPFLTLIDTACVGNLGVDTAAGLAALAASGAVFDVLANVLASLCTAATNVVAAGSARGPDALRRAVRVSLTISLALGVCGAAAVLLGSQRLVSRVFMLSSPAVVSRALGYMRLRGAFVPVVCVNYALYGVLLARADTGIAVRAVAVSALANTGLDLLLVGACGLSTVGAACGTVAAQLCVCTILMRHVYASLPPLSHQPRAGARAQPGGARARLLPTVAELRPFGAVFGAVGFGTALTAIVHAAAAQVVAASGSVPSAAAYQVSFQAVSLLSCFAVPLNLGVQSLLAAARVSGSTTRVRALVSAVIGQSAIVGAAVGASAALLLRYCVRLLTSDPSVALRVHAIVPLCALTACAWCQTSALYGVFVALGLLRAFVAVALLGAAGGLAVLFRGGGVVTDPLQRAWLGALAYSAIRICAYAPLLLRAIPPDAEPRPERPRM